MPLFPSRAAQATGPPLGPSPCGPGACAPRLGSLHTLRASTSNPSRERPAICLSRVFGVYYEWHLWGWERESGLPNGGERRAQGVRSCYPTPSHCLGPFAEQSRRVSWPKWSLSTPFRPPRDFRRALGGWKAPVRELPADGTGSAWPLRRSVLRLPSPRWLDSGHFDKNIRPVSTAAPLPHTPGEGSLRPHPSRKSGMKTGTGTSPEPVFWVVVEGWPGGESPFLNHARKSSAPPAKRLSDACGHIGSARGVRSAG